MLGARRFLGVFVATAVLVTACGLDVSGTGGGSGASSAPTRPDAAAPDASNVGPVGSVDASLEASPSDAPAAEASACDLDADGHAAKSCGGDDCCDNDARVHPGADWQGTAAACGSFDFNCDGKEEREHGVKGCHVSGICQGDGFDQDTPCGAQAGYATCLGLFVCLGEYPDSRTQRCR